MPNAAHDKSSFKTRHPIHKLSLVEQSYQLTFLQILQGKIKEGVIAALPITAEPLYIDLFKILDIGRKHGDIPLENLIITANEPTSMICGVQDNIPYVTLLYEFQVGGFVLSTRKFNGHYVVTFFESADSMYLEAIKKRGDVTTLKEKSSD
jgi:hypothetical protein